MFNIRRFVNLRRISLDWLRHPKEVGVVALFIVVGLLTGLGAVLFHVVLQQTGPFLRSLDAKYVLPLLGQGSIVLIPVVGALSAAMLIWLFARHDRSQGVSTVMEAVALRGGRLPERPLLAKVLATAVFVSSGGSAGSWTPIVLLGAVVGSQFGRRLRLSDERVRTLVASGVAGATAAAFNAPIAGVFFALEVVIGGLSTNLFALVVLAAVAASAVSQTLLGDQPAFAIPQHYTLINPAVELPLYALLGIPAAIIGVLFIKSIYAVEDYLVGHQHSIWVRAAAIGLVVGFVGLALPEVLGVGYEVIETILDGTDDPTAWLATLLIAKLLLTALSVAGMGIGGTFAPSLFLGAMLGALYGAIVHELVPGYTAPPAAYALVAMGAVLTAVVRAPITATLLLFEMTNDYLIMLPLMFCIATTSLVAHRLFPESLDTGRLARRGIVLRFGRDLNIMQLVRIDEAMSRDFPTLPSGSTLREATDLFNAARFRGVPVVDQTRWMVGLITSQDVSRALEQGHNDSLPVDEIMTRDVMVAYPDQTLDDAMRLFAIKDVGRLPVVDRDNPRKLCGLLRRHDLARAYNLGLLKRTEIEQRVQQMKLHSHSGAEVVELEIDGESPLAGQSVGAIELPQDSLVVTIRRDQQSLLPRADMTIQPGDRLVCLAAPSVVNQLETRVRVKHAGPEEPHYFKATVAPGSSVAGRPVKEIDLPRGALLVAIQRDHQRLLPHGDTVLQPNDEVTFFVEHDYLRQAVANCLCPLAD
jgi:CIC family chloride channel protein